jgi:hypothetical protein
VSSRHRITIYVLMRERNLKCFFSVKAHSKNEVKSESWFKFQVKSLSMAAKLKIMFACLTYTCLKSAQGHNSKPLTCGDYRVLGHQSVFQLDNFSKWPCQIFFNVNDKCRPRHGHKFSRELQWLCDYRMHHFQNNVCFPDF